MFFCAGGLRSALAAKTAQDMGLKPVAHILGGFKAWKDAGGPTEPGGAEERRAGRSSAHCHPGALCPGSSHQRAPEPCCTLDPGDERRDDME